jgi:hypothetical protein
VAGLVVGVAYTYTARTLFNPWMFSHRVAESLAQPTVARVVADQVADQILERNRDLTPYRPVVRGAVEYIISSPPFRAVVQRAAKEAHARLISEAGHDFTLTLADLGVVLRNGLAMYPQIAEKIPDRAEAVIDVVTNSPIAEKLLALLRIGHRLRVRAMACLVIGLVMGALGILLAHRKDRYLLRFGIGLAITSFFLAGIARFGGAGLAEFARTPVGADLIRGLWPAFVGPLAIRMLVLGAIGLVLVSAVTSLLEKINLAAIGRGVWVRVAAQQPRAGWGMVRGLLLLAFGILVSFQPIQTIIVLVVVVGAVIFFLGVQELFTTAVRFAPRRGGAAVVSEDGRRLPVPAVVVVCALVLVFVGASGFWLARHSDAVAEETPVDACNGSAKLCDRRLNEVAFATTHNSMAAADISKWMFPNQERGIRGQLEDGIRGFLIDIHYGVHAEDVIKTMIENEEVSRKKYEATLGKEGVEAAMRIRDRLIGKEEGEPDVYLCHGFCELGAMPFVQALEEMKDFLVENPNEVVIIVIQDEGVKPVDVAVCFAKSGLDKFVYRGSVEPPWPTLREMIESDERVLVFAENNAEGVPWYHPVFDVFQETPYGFKTPEEFSNKPNRGGKTGSMLLMNHWIETTPAPLPSNAEIVNAYDFLLQRARACRKERGMIPNLVAVDFYRTGDLIRVVRKLNGVPEPVGVTAASR